MGAKSEIREVGLVGFVTCGKRLSDITDVMILNDVGGSNWLPPGRYRVRVTHGFHDYETGDRLHGELLDEKDVKLARKIGTTGHAKEAKGARLGLDLIDPDQRKFNPRKVYFPAKAFEPEHAVKEFKVAAVSSNRNSFGLRGHVLVARDGEAWQVAVNNLNEREKGQIVRFAVVGGHVKVEPTAVFFFEIPERLKDAPPAVVREVWGKVKK